MLQGLSYNNDRPLPKSQQQVIWKENYSPITCILYNASCAHSLDQLKLFVVRDVKLSCGFTVKVVSVDQ